MSEDILKIMEAIRDEARAEGAAQPGSDFYKQGLLAPDVRAIVPADWSAPVPAKKQGPLTGIGTAGLTQKTRQVGTVAAPSDTTEPAADDAAGLNPGQFLRRGVRVSPPPLDTDVSRPPKDIIVGHKYHDDD